MKGVIAISLQDLVKSRYGADKWENILVKSGLPKDLVIFGHHDIDDNIIIKVLGNACQVLGLSMQQLGDAFGDYWINTYAKQKYFAFFSGMKNAKDFLLKMNYVHSKLTETIENANPPKFTFAEITDNSVIMNYISNRNLEDIWIGLIKGVGKYFDETISIERLSKNSVRLKFNKP